MQRPSLILSSDFKGVLRYKGEHFEIQNVTRYHDFTSAGRKVTVARLA
jgi:hypothetical protein